MENEEITTIPPGEGDPPDPGAIIADPPPAQEIPPASTDPEKDNVQKRIDTITREKYDAQRDADYWRRVAEENKKTEVPVAPVVTELDPMDFDSNELYLKAVANKVRDDVLGSVKADRENEENNRRKATLAAQYKEAGKKYTDFASVALSQAHPITQSMFDAAQGDSLTDILYTLGKNPAEARRISTLSPIQQAKEIGKIEDRITTKPPVKTNTSAPTPPTTLGGGGGEITIADGDKSRSELHAKWEKERVKAIKNRR